MRTPIETTKCKIRALKLAGRKDLKSLYGRPTDFMVSLLDIRPNSDFTADKSFFVYVFPILRSRPYA
jgi:hypothetical protein